MGSENYNVIAYDITAETAEVAAEVGYALQVQVVNRFSPIAFTWRAPDTGHLLEASGSVAVNESKVPAVLDMLHDEGSRLLKRGVTIALANMDPRGMDLIKRAIAHPHP